MSGESNYERDDAKVMLDVMLIDSSRTKELGAASQRRKVPH